VHHVAETRENISTEKARAGSSEHVVRYVLLISLGLAIAAMVAVLIVW